MTAAEFRRATAAARGHLELRIDFARGGKLPCPECGALCPAYDTDAQRWRHLNFFEHETHLIARVPRVECATHGVLRAQVPWARPGSGFTLLFEAFVVLLAAEMPMAALARLVGDNDTRFWRLVEWHVEDAGTQVDMRAVTSVVVDETSRAKRHHYVSRFLEPSHRDGADETRAGPVRDRRALARGVSRVRDRSRDAWRRSGANHRRLHGQEPRVSARCRRSAARRRGDARSLPRDEAGGGGARRRAAAGAQAASRTVPVALRVGLTNPANLSARQQEMLERLSTTNLLPAKAYQLRLNIQALWERRVPAAAERYLRRWSAWSRARRSRRRPPAQPWVLEAMHRTAQTLRDNAHGILNYFRLRLTSGVIESVNSLAQAARALARGYRNPETFKTIIYLLAGRLPFNLPNVATHSS